MPPDQELDGVDAGDELRCPMCDDEIGLENPVVYRGTIFCCQECADEYFDEVMYDYDMPDEDMDYNAT